MKKDEFNAKFREYARTLSPRQSERDLISKIYDSICDFLGTESCLQIGSYPRFTAITPVHDLDVLYVIGNWDENTHDPTTILQALASRFDEYLNPTNYRVELAPPQTHSISILFKDTSGEEVFSVDIVPAYIFSKNEFIHRLLGVRIRPHDPGGMRQTRGEAVGDDVSIQGCIPEPMAASGLAATNREGPSERNLDGINIRASIRSRAEKRAKRKPPGETQVLC